MSIAESLFLGNLPVNRYRQVDWKHVHRTTEELLKAENLQDNPRLNDGVRTKLKYLSIADIQMLEIAKAISKNSRVLIMDEPTSSISEKEVDVLLAKVLDLKERGTCVIYISHKMNEIFKIADQITVFRDGRAVCSKAASELSIDQVITLMVGRELSNTYPKRHIQAARRLLTVKHLSRRGVFSDINFHLDAGEIVGFAGLVGAGRTEVARALSGLDPIDSGTIEIEGKETAIRTVAASIKNGIAMCSEDRRRYGLVLVRSVRENIALPNLKRFIYRGRLHKKKELREVAEQCALLNVKAPNIETLTSHLSGGNQQKLVLAKWLLKDPSILILDEPTRGIDVGAKYEIYKFMTEIVKDGQKGVIMISSEMPELLGMCDRIYVMCERKITAEFSRDEFSQETIMHYATGTRKQ